MNIELGDGRATLERLLSQLAGRLDGAVDMWTLVCLGDIAIDRRAFIERHAAEMQALAVEAGALLRRAAPGDAAALDGLFEELTRENAKLRDIFVVLEQYQTIPLEAIHLATTGLAEVYDDLRRTLRTIGDTASVSAGFLERRPDQQAYFRRILDGLYEQFRQRRDAGLREPTPAVAP